MSQILVRPEAVDRLALRVADLLGPKIIEAFEARLDAERDELVDAGTVADALGVQRPWVYSNADRLGAVRLGDGDRPRLRFSVALARERLAGERQGRTHQELRNGVEHRRPM